MAVPLLWRERREACVGDDCVLEFGADSCQAYGQPCCMAGTTRQEFTCHASVCRCRQCPIMWPRSRSDSCLTPLLVEVIPAKEAKK